MKMLSGKIVSIKMKDTVIVEMTRRVAHPKYKKLQKRTSKIQVHAPNHAFALGTVIKIVETRPISKNKNFMVMEAKATKAVKEKAK